jgi:hypothetical protein
MLLIWPFTTLNNITLEYMQVAANAPLGGGKSLLTSLSLSRSPFWSTFHILLYMQSFQCG